MVIVFFINILILISLLNPIVSSVSIINFLNHPSYVIIPKDNFSKIKCQINVPNAKYSWLFIDHRTNVEQQVVQNQYISLYNDGVMILKHHTSTAGKYRCRSIVPDIGIVISSVTQVDLADMFIDKLSLSVLGNGYYKIRDRAVLVCPFSAVPQSEVEYKWVLKFPESRKFITSSKTTVFHQNGRILELEVNNLTYGSYFCTAVYSKYGLERTSSDIDVRLSIASDNTGTPQLKWIAKPLETLFTTNKERFDRYIHVYSGQQTLITKEGTGNLELICVVNSNSSSIVEILWLKNNVLIDRESTAYDKFFYKITGQGTLTLINVTRKYSGFYTCQASIKEDRSVISAQSFKLIVKPILRFLYKPSPIIVGDKNQEIRLRCSVDDIDSKNKIVWRKNGEFILGNKFLKQYDGFLHILNLLDSDEGIFQCLVDNEFSSIQATTQLKIRKNAIFPDRRPLLVNKLRVKAVSFGTLNISWSHAIPGFETILHYEITLFDLSNLTQNNQKIILKADRLESSILVKNLVPDSFYKIFVSSVNGSGKSYPAVINSSPRVLSKAPTAPPTNVRIFGIGSTVSNISWGPPNASQINGELIGYRLSVSSSDSIYSKSFDLTVVEKLQLSDLAPDTKYAVYIQALTRGGRGPLSPAVYFETKDSPNENDELFNRMQRKTLKDMKTKLYYPSGSEESRQYGQHADSPSQIVSWLAKGLNASIVLQWVHPVEGGLVKKYIIKWGKVYPGPSQATIQYPTNSYVINNLEFRTQYMIKIIPINEAGNGKEVLFSAFTGNQDLTGRIAIPLNLGVNKVDMTEAMLSWEDPSNEISNTRIYQIRYSSQDKDLSITKMKNSTENKVQLTGLRPSTSYSFSVRTGDIILLRDGDYVNKEWTWSEWSLKESFNTKGERPTKSPQNFKLIINGIPDVRKNDVYTRITASWTIPNKNSNNRDDEITRYTIYFTSDPKIDLRNWHTQILPADQYSSEINLNGIQKIYYFRIGCRTKNYECPLSRILLYKTSDAEKQNYGVLRIPEKYYYNINIPLKYLMAKPFQSLEPIIDEQINVTKDVLWIMIGGCFAAGIFLIVAILMAIIWHRKQTQTSFPGYKLGTKSSIQNIGGAGLLLSNQSPALSNGKVSPHFVRNYNQPLKTPDLFPHPEPHFLDIESDSNQDNDSLRFASVSQHHLASTSGTTNIFNTTIQNHSLLRSHPQMVSYYSDMHSHSKPAIINASGILNPLINNSISIPIQIQDNSLQRTQHQSPACSYQGHPFTQHLLNTGIGMPICSSSCLQPVNLSAQMLVSPPLEVHSPTNFSNTPRVNASELASHTSSEDIRPLMNSSRVSECDISHYYGGVSNNTGKPHSNNPQIETVRNSDVIKPGIDATENDVSKGFSTEELSQEMANLEGLMKDLNAITQKEFEC